jgi:CheY-like chemotaxis protein
MRMGGRQGTVARARYVLYRLHDSRNGRMTTLQRCCAEPGAKDVRAVMLTADSRLATLERELSFGFDEFLPKPILDQDGFLQRINDVMTRRRQ